jgi:hypothetical protein
MLDIEHGKLTLEEKTILSEWMSAAKFGPAATEFFTALPMIALFHLIVLHRDGMLAFLGRRPGKTFDVKGTFKTLMREVKSEVINHVFPFGTAILAVAEAAVTTPMEKQIEQMQAGSRQLEPVLKLRSFTKELSARAESIAGIIPTSELAVREALPDVDRTGRAVLEILQRLQRRE